MNNKLINNNLKKKNDKFNLKNEAEFNKVVNAARIKQQNKTNINKNFSSTNNNINNNVNKSQIGKNEIKAKEVTLTEEQNKDIRMMLNGTNVDNSNLNNNNDNQNENGNQENLDEPKIKTKKKANNKYKFDEKNLLFGEKGLKYLYEEMTKTDFNSKNDKLNLDKFMKLIKTWHFLLKSKFEFNYFLLRVRELGTKPAVKVRFKIKNIIYLGIYE